MKISLLFVVALAMTGCAASQNVAPDMASAAAEEKRPPLFPYWTEWGYGKPPYGGSVRPSGVAALIAPGYLVTANDGLTSILRDTRTNPALWLFDPSRRTWHRGVIVMDDGRGMLSLVLLRADVAGTPLRLADMAETKLATNVVAGFVTKHWSLGARIDTWHLSFCERSLNYFIAGKTRHQGFCPRGETAFLPGSAVLDEEGKLVALKTTAPSEAFIALDHGTGEIRWLFDTYFGSWGRYIPTKPELPGQHHPVVY